MRKVSWSTETRKVSELIPHPKNPRRITEKQIEDLKESLTRFNLAEIPVINTDNQLLAGHQRMKIMVLLERGEEVIDVRVPSRKLTKPECEEYLLRSNKNTAEWDFDLLAEFEMDDLKTWGFEDFEIPQPPTEPVPPNEFPPVGSDIETDHQCPKCGYEWSGSTK